MTGVPWRRIWTRTGRKACEHESKDQGDAPISHARPKTTRKPPEAKRKAHQILLLDLKLLAFKTEETIDSG